MKKVKKDIAKLKKQMKRQKWINVYLLWSRGG
jgi:hypothetical protein